jgi:hypothetical protein
MGPPSKISLGIIGQVLLLNHAFLAKSFASESSSGLIAIYRKTIISNFLNPSEKTAENMEHFMTHADLENLYRFGRKGGKKRRKLCTPEILVTHLRRIKIGVVYYLHRQWVCFESAGLNFSSSV